MLYFRSGVLFVLFFSAFYFLAGLPLEMEESEDVLFDVGLDKILSQSLGDLVDSVEERGGSQGSRSRLSLLGRPRMSLFYEMPRMPVCIYFL